MAHFARLDEYGYVTQVIVVANQDTADENGNEDEAIGRAFCEQLLGGRWVQTSYNANFRGKFAGPGDYYDEEKDVFR